MMVALRPDLVVLSAGISDAFPSIARDAVLLGLQNHAPQFLPLLSPLLRGSVRHVVMGGHADDPRLVTQSAGLDQGCPLSMSL